MAVEKSFTNHIFIDLRERDFKGLNWWFVSRRGASRDPGTDVSVQSNTMIEYLQDGICNACAVLRVRDAIEYIKTFHKGVDRDSYSKFLTCLKFFYLGVELFCLQRSTNE